MAKYFLGSVGRAEAFRISGDTKTLMFVSNTTTENSINISTTQDELRAGTGAAVVATFTHDPNVEINLVDVFWRREYLAAQLGLNFEGNASAYQINTCTAKKAVLSTDPDYIILDKIPLAIDGACGKTASPLVWLTVSGKDDWELFNGSFDTTDERKLTGSQIVAGKEYCVRYLAQDANAVSACVNSNIIPDELFLIITQPIYAGEACAASNGQVAGELIFEIPRFKLNGNQDFSFAMSSNTTMSLAGKALGAPSSCDMRNGSRLLRVIEIIDGRGSKKWYEDLKAVYIDPEYILEDDTTIPLYGVYKDNTVVLLDNNAENGNSTSTTKDYAFTFTAEPAGAATHVKVDIAVKNESGTTIFADTDITEDKTGSATLTVNNTAPNKGKVTLTAPSTTQSEN